MINLLAIPHCRAKVKIEILTRSRPVYLADVSMTKVYLENIRSEKVHQNY